MRRPDPRAVLERGDIGIGPARFTLGDQPCRHGLGQAVDLPQAKAERDIPVLPAPPPFSAARGCLAANIL